jgi:hypothetical protein
MLMRAKDKQCLACVCGKEGLLLLYHQGCWDRLVVQD